VIDDNKQTTEALSKMLKLRKITARPALSPSVAMAILRRDTPAIVFLEINILSVDGFEVLAYLRSELRVAK
jgi:PleD family two-component response regulator